MTIGNLEALRDALIEELDSEYRTYPSDGIAATAVYKCTYLIRSLDLSAHAVKVPEDVQSVRELLIDRLAEYTNGLVEDEIADIAMKADDLIESLAAQVAEKDRRIAELEALLTECRKREVLNEAKRHR